jgi:NADH pyrophosphatase NudC (nudix superfamily)
LNLANLETTEQSDMHIDLHIALLTVLTVGVGYVMMVAGLQKSVLEWRRRQRICPSCGRILETRVCRVCTG